MAANRELADGLIDAVHSDGSSTVLLFRGAEFITANLQTRAVTTAPAPISSYAPWQNHIPAAWAASGFDAAMTFSNGNTVIYNGPAAVSFSAQTQGIAPQQYIPALYPTWPATWHPQMAHAPSGRVTRLYVATKAGPIVFHDGERWNLGTQNAAGNSVSVGKDGIVYASSTGGLFRFDGATWTQMVAPPAALQQVAVGDDGHMWVRDSSNAVHSFSHTGNAYTPADLGAGVPNPTHMAANADGTLWHCNNAPTTPTPFRFLSQSGTASASVTVQTGVVTNVQKVASTGFGAAHILATTHTGATQLYAYDSPYLFKTSDSYSLMGNADTGFNSTGGVMVHGGGRVYDEINQLVYVGAAPWNNDIDQTTPGQLIALDAATLQVKWTFNTVAGIDAVPALQGTQLCFGDRQGHLYMFNTRKAAAAGPSPVPDWTWQLPIAAAQTHRVTTPALFNDSVYVALWDVNTGYNCQDACLEGSAISWCTCRADGTQRSPAYEIEGCNETNVLPGMFQTPVRGYANFADQDN